MGRAALQVKKPPKLYTSFVLAEDRKKGGKDLQRYSDLVLESCMAAGTLPGGVTVEEQTEEEVEVSIVRITDEEGEKAVGKPRGSYVTLTAPHMAGSDPEIDKRCAKHWQSSYVP